MHVDAWGGTVRRGPRGFDRGRRMTQETTPVRVWWICALLLCASTINYMDRQTLSNSSEQIKAAFHLDKPDADGVMRGNQYYARLEWAFGWAFAAGATIFGFIVDRTNIRWLYPVVLLAWSTMGFLTGFVETYAALFACRLFLGLFEAGHWPCALKTTQRLLPPSKRTLGNSVLQSGTAIGAIVTPLILKAYLTDDVYSWRPAFKIIGMIGVGWAIMWLITIRGDELKPELMVEDQSTPSASFFQTIYNRRFLTLLLVVNLINIAYHFFRVWMAGYLQKGRGYTPAESLDFTFWYYISNDVGCIAAGMLTVWLSQRGWSASFARSVVFTGCGVLAAFSVLLPFLPSGWPFFIVMMMISMGLLGVFPCYYAFSQDLSRTHQGKVSGLLGTTAWLVVSPLHEVFGKGLDQSGQHEIGLAVVGTFPLIAAACLAIGWRNPVGQAVPD